jgi:hypothetical protein
MRRHYEVNPYIPIWHMGRVWSAIESNCQMSQDITPNAEYGRDIARNIWKLTVEDEWLTWKGEKL